MAGGRVWPRVIWLCKVSYIAGSEKGSRLMTSPRERMVVSAALLIRERGAQPTAIADVLEHSGAPRGSAYHYFPGGRTQLLCEAIDYSCEYVASKIVGAAVEAGDPARQDQATPVIDRAAAAFARWTELIAQRLIADGVSETRAE